MYYMNGVFRRKSQNKEYIKWLSSESKISNKEQQVASGNEIFYFFHDHLSDKLTNIHMSRSFDSGRNFGPFVKITSSKHYCDLLRFVKKDKYLTFVWNESPVFSGDTSNVFFRQSSDNGESFTEPKMISDKQNYYNRSESLIRSQNTILIVWYEFDFDSNITLCFSLSPDSGNTFVKKIFPNTSIGGLFSSDDNIHLLKDEWDPITFTGHLYFEASHDGGVSFSRTKITTTEKAEIYVLNYELSGSKISVVWTEVEGDKYDIMYSYSEDTGQSFTEPKMIEISLNT